MKNFFRSFSKWDYLFFAICGIAYFFLIRQYIPCVEDLVYRFSKINNTPIDSISDAIFSQIYDYTHINGRFLVHTLVQYFCGMTNPVIFFVISSIVFAVLIMTMTWLVRFLNFTIISADKYVLTLGILLLIPRIGMTYFGHIAFVINYLWSSAIYVCFLAIYIYLKREKPSCKTWQSILLCLFAFIAGTWQESFSIGIAGTLFIYHLISIKDTKGLLLSFLLCFAIGAIVGIFAPGNFVRFSQNVNDLSTTSFFYEWWIKFYRGVKGLVFFNHGSSVSFFTIVFLFAILPIYLTKWEFLKEKYMLIFPPLIMSLFGAIIVRTGEHQFVSVSLFGLMLLYSILLTLLPKIMYSLSTPLAIISLVGLVIIYIPAYHFREKLFEANETMKISMQNSIDSIALSTDIDFVDTEYISDSYWRRYTGLEFIQWNYKSRYHHQLYSKYLMRGKPRTNVAIPDAKEMIIGYCNEFNKNSDHVYNFPNKKYIIVCIPLEWDISKIFVNYYLSNESNKKTEGMASPSILRFPLERPLYLGPTRWFVEGLNKYIIIPKPLGEDIVSASLDVE